MRARVGRARGDLLTCVDGSEVLVGSVPYGGLSGVIVYISIDLLSQLLIDMRNLLELRRYEWSTPLPVIV